MPEVTPEEEARLTTEQITEGVKKAQEAVNAPSLDLVAFEEQLKAKHQEFQKAGITPRLKVPLPK